MKITFLRFCLPCLKRKEKPQERQATQLHVPQAPQQAELAKQNEVEVPQELTVIEQTVNCIDEKNPHIQPQFQDQSAVIEQPVIDEKYLHHHIQQKSPKASTDTTEDDYVTC